MFLLLATGCADDPDAIAPPVIGAVLIAVLLVVLYYLGIECGLDTHIDRLIRDFRRRCAYGIPCPHLGYSCRTCTDRATTITHLQQSTDTLRGSLAQLTADNHDLVAKSDEDRKRITEIERERAGLHDRIAGYEHGARQAQDFQNALLQKETALADKEAALVSREGEIDAAREAIRRDAEELQAQALRDAERLRRRQLRDEAAYEQACADDDDAQYLAQAHAIVEDIEQKYVLHDAAHTHHAVAALIYWGDRSRGVTHVAAHNHTVQSIKLRLERTPVQLRESYEAMQRWKLFDAEMVEAEARTTDAARDAEVRAHAERMAAWGAHSAAAQLAVAQVDQDIFAGGDLGHDED